MEFGGGYTLTDEQIAAWKEKDYDEYLDYYTNLYDEETGVWYDLPTWMDDGKPNNGPFDFNLNLSHGTAGT